MNQSAVILPTEAASQLGFVASTLASGAVKSKLLSRKEYGERHGLKGAELKRQHYDYLKSNGVKLGAVMAGGLAGGQIIPQSISYNPATGRGTLNWVDSEKFGQAPAPAKGKRLSDDELIEELLRRKLNLAPLLKK